MKHTINNSQNGITLSIRKADVLEIRLPENPTTGFKWQIHAEDDFIIDEEFEPGAPGLPGNKGEVIFSVTAKRSGFSSCLHAELKQPWNKTEAAADEFNCTVQVNS